jgi:tripartite ATP-independent transporter DctM subunit
MQAGLTMNLFWMGSIVTLVALVFLFSGMPIAFALGVSALVPMFLFMDAYQISMVAETVYEGVNDFSLLSIPLFIFMGMIAAISRAGGDLYESFHRWLYKVPGGLGIGNIAACAVFAALTGSSPATAAAIGTMGIPEMRKRGYSNGLATGIITAGGTLGILIPPSVTMIIYGIVTETSIGKLFIGGIIPGILMAVLFSAWVPIAFILDRRKKILAGIPLPIEESYTLSQKLTATIKVIPFIVVVALVLGSLYTGWATPSEAAAVGAFLILLIAMIF